MRFSAYNRDMFAKFLLTAFVIWVAWRWFIRPAIIRGMSPQGGTGNAAGNPFMGGSVPPRPAQSSGGRVDRETGNVTVDLVQCPTCNSYIARNSQCACGYKDRG